VGVAEQLVLPGADAAVAVDAGVEADRHGRAERLPCVLVGAIPDQRDRRTGPRHGDDGGVERGVVGAVVPVATRALDVLHDDVLGADRQDVGDRHA
jgi:hypothetical protein